eukprot:Gb_11977 [translate_table: standard]
MDIMHSYGHGNLRILDLDPFMMRHPWEGIVHALMILCVLVVIKMCIVTTGRTIDVLARDCTSFALVYKHDLDLSLVCLSACDVERRGILVVREMTLMLRRLGDFYLGTLLSYKGWPQTIKPFGVDS